MKDSGVAWIGKIPEHWELSKMKRVLRNASIKGHPEAQVLSLYREYGVIPKDSRDDNHNVTSEDTASYKYVENGDLVINKMKAWQGSLGLSQYEGIVSPAYYVCKFISNRISRKFLHHLIRSKAYAQEFERLSTGMRVGQWDLGIDDFLRVPLLLPPFPEQEAIAAYLDEKCAGIDDIIAEAKASIEEYKAWKASVIFEVVTKGLDPNAEMKDSGVQWIGEIPKGWEITPFGKIATIKACLVDPKMYLSLPQISPENIEKGSARLLDTFKSVNASGVISWNHLFHKGQIIYSKVRPTLNKLFLAQFEGLCSADMYPIETAQNIKFLVYAMLSESFVQQVAAVTANRVKMPKINRHELSKITVVLPPTNEQTAIAAYLDEKCAAIDGIIAEKESLIAELETYKKSLVFETVTGKRRVC